MNAEHEEKSLLEKYNSLEESYMNIVQELERIKTYEKSTKHETSTQTDLECEPKLAIQVQSYSNLGASRVFASCKQRSVEHDLSQNAFESEST